MTYSLAADVTLTDTENGMVLLDERTGRYWQLNITGATVLRCLLDGGTVDSAVASFLTRYPDVGEQITADVKALLHALQVAKLIAP